MLFLALLTCLPISHGYSDGRVTPACGSMTPGHEVTAQNSTAPYSITTSSNTYKKGQNITVSITANSPSTMPFKGFFIQARTADSTDAVGHFYGDKDTQKKLIYCPAGSSIGNAVSHASPVAKTAKTFIWSNTDGSDVFFQGTFVNNRTTFWTDVLSTSVHYVSDGSTTQYNAMTVSLLLFIGVLQA